MLSKEQLARYRNDGFYILNNFSSRDECRILRERALLLVENSGAAVDPRSVCKAKTAGYISYAYFLESLNKASLFFDSSAVAPDGTLIKDKHKSVVKIGHALHDDDPVFEKYSHSTRMHKIARNLGINKPLVGQSRYYFRPPGINTELSAHQDSAVLYTDPPSCYAVWLALDDVTIENGCMWARPGSHTAGVRRRVIKGKAYGQSQLEMLSDFERSDDAPFIPLEVDEGTAILMSGELIHKSGQNISTGTRQAYTVHFIEGDESHKYPGENWLQRSGGFRELRALGENL